MHRCQAACSASPYACCHPPSMDRALTRTGGGSRCRVVCSGAGRDTGGCGMPGPNDRCGRPAFSWGPPACRRRRRGRSGSGRTQATPSCRSVSRSRAPSALAGGGGGGGFNPRSVRWRRRGARGWATRRSRAWRRTRSVWAAGIAARRCGSGHGAGGCPGTWRGRPRRGACAMRPHPERRRQGAVPTTQPSQAPTAWAWGCTPVAQRGDEPRGPRPGARRGGLDGRPGRGEPRRPRVRHRAWARRSWLHGGCASARRRRNACRSAGMEGRPAREAPRPPRRLPGRCHWRRVAGCTRPNAGRQSHQLDRPARAPRVVWVARLGVTWRAGSRAKGWRSKRLSAARAVGERRQRGRKRAASARRVSNVQVSRERRWSRGVPRTRGPSLPLRQELWLRVLSQRGGRSSRGLQMALLRTTSGRRLCAAPRGRPSGGDGGAVAAARHGETDGAAVQAGDGRAGRPDERRGGGPARGRAGGLGLRSGRVEGVVVSCRSARLPSRRGLQGVPRRGATARRSCASLPETFSSLRIASADLTGNRWLPTGAWQGA